MTKYDPARDLPQFARELKTLSPTLLMQEVLKKRNEEITTQSISNYFRRHPDVWEMLNKEIVQGLPTETQAVGDDIFRNGSFQEIKSVREWINYLSAVRRIKDETLKGLVGCLRQICAGRLPIKHIDFVADGKWCLKHPDRLSYQDALTFISLLRERQVDPYMFCKTLKSFLVSKGITEAAKIMVGKHGSFGRFKELYVERPKLDAMLQWVYDTHGTGPYLIDMIMFTKAFRVGAVLKAKIENMTKEGRITLFEKGLERKYGAEGKQVTRLLSTNVTSMLRIFAEGRINGPFFKDITEDQMADINNEAILKFCPEVLTRYGHVNPNHFWRHMFAQHMLRLTKWHTAKVAKLGNWTEQALKESYGDVPDDIAEEWSEEYTLEVTA